MKLLIATMAGGHSHHAQYLIKENEKEEAVVVTSKGDGQNYQADRVYKLTPMRHKPEARIKTLGAIKNFFGSLWILLKEQPANIYCCGANNSLLLGLLGLLVGIQTVAIEASNRIESPSKSPQLLHWLGAEVWVSNSRLAEEYGKRVEIKGFMHPYADNFKEWRQQEKENRYLIVPSSCENWEGEKVISNLEQEKLLEKMGQTKTVLARAGLTAWEAAQLAEEVIVVPLKEAHENHQEEFARWLKEEFDNIKVRQDFQEEIKKLESEDK